MLDVLAPAQREVGRRWEEGSWSVAQEHAATAVTDVTLGLLALDAEPAGKGWAVVGCVEGEWHALPARMAAEILPLRGWEVTFLGPSLPSDELSRVCRRRPDVVGLSCSMPFSLRGAARSVAACRKEGVPVLTGGSGFGPGGRYASRLGATGWAPDPAAAVTLLEDWTRTGAPSKSPSPPVDDEHLELELENDAIVSQAMAHLDWEDRGAKEALVFLISTLENALFVDDPAAMAGSRPAVDRMLAGCQRTGVSGTTAVEALVGVLHGRLSRAQQFLEQTWSPGSIRR